MDEKSAKTKAVWIWVLRIVVPVVAAVVASAGFVFTAGQRSATAEARICQVEKRLEENEIAIKELVMCLQANIGESTKSSKQVSEDLIRVEERVKWLMRKEGWVESAPE